MVQYFPALLAIWGGGRVEEIFSIKLWPVGEGGGKEMRRWRAS